MSDTTSTVPSCEQANGSIENESYDSGEIDGSNEPVTWLQLILNTILQIIARYRQAKEECAQKNECGEEVESTSTLHWLQTCVFPWLQLLKNLILQIYAKLNPKSEEEEGIYRAKCYSCGYIIGRSNLDYMMLKRR